MDEGKTVALVHHGKWLGGKLPLGYKYNVIDRKTKDVVIEPEKAKIVRDIFKVKAKMRLSNKRIGEHFGIARTSIYTIIRNKVYIGESVHTFKGSKGKVRLPQLVKKKCFVLANRRIDNQRKPRSK